jgi:hypothetical protein
MECIGAVQVFTQRLPVVVGGAWVVVVNSQQYFASVMEMGYLYRKP